MEHRQHCPALAVPASFTTEQLPDMERTGPAPLELALPRTAATGVLKALLAESWREWEPDVDAMLPLTDLHNAFVASQQCLA